jgi:hypothetical protein
MWRVFSGGLPVVAFWLGLALLPGCQSARTFDGVIEYRNKSKDTLYVSELSGFDHPATCGYLVPDGTAVCTCGR